MERIRAPFQGITNIIRFNWHFYVIALGAIIALVFIGSYFPAEIQFSTYVFCALIILSAGISLFVSYYVYDRSGLYDLSWLEPLITGKENTVINVNAGFDETSNTLKHLFPTADLRVFDFYDPAKHTEVSIKRARAAYPLYPGTETITTNYLPVQEASVDLILLIFAAHEIRDDDERKVFFGQLHQKLKPGGKIIIVEHLRDFLNFFAYNIGFFHFHSLQTWRQTFNASGFKIDSKKKISPFVTLFILKKA
ncbi:MAG: methyltransferase [Citrobacter freundii]|nr:MAG: methyltransferase [Citrobacter freundii]